MPESVLRRFLLDTSCGAEVASELSLALRGVQSEVLVSRLRQILNWDIRAELQKCVVPILYLAASRDRLIGSRGLEAARQVMPGIEVVTIDGPHLLLQAKPEEAATIITGYLRRWFAD
jgi:pimeloyl-ACP methyl ester carboxylesterase